MKISKVEVSAFKFRVNYLFQKSLWGNSYQVKCKPGNLLQSRRLYTWTFTFLKWRLCIRAICVVVKYKFGQPVRDNGKILQTGKKKSAPFYKIQTAHILFFIYIYNDSPLEFKGKALWKTLRPCTCVFFFLVVSPWFRIPAWFWTDFKFPWLILEFQMFVVGDCNN